MNTSTTPITWDELVANYKSLQYSVDLYKIQPTRYCKPGQSYVLDLNRLALQDCSAEHDPRKAFRYLVICHPSDELRLTLAAQDAGVLYYGEQEEGSDAAE